MNFGDLKGDKEIQEKLISFHESVENIDSIVESANSIDFEKLKPEEKANYDLFLAYILNTTYWMYLRSRGVDPNQDQVKGQLNRVKEYMLKAKQASERHLRPKVDKPAVERFIKHGIQHHRSSNNTDNANRNRKRKRRD